MYDIFFVCACFVFVCVHICVYVRDCVYAVCCEGACVLEVMCESFGVKVISESLNLVFDQAL